MESLDDKIRRVTAEAFEIVEYDPGWPGAFEREKERLLRHFPKDSVVRVEHVGSTAVPGLAAKPVVDVLVGVRDLSLVREQVAPRLEAQGYDYFWRPTHDDDVPPFYAFFIRRDEHGVRTHHIHVVGMQYAEHWDWVVFRDHLRANREAAARYERLKRRLAQEFAHDRVRYTKEKGPFILRTLAEAKAARSAVAWGDRSTSPGPPGGAQRAAGGES